MQWFSRTPFAALLTLVLASGMTTGSFAGDKQYGPGVTDTEIKIGQTTAYSGPASAYGLLSKTQVAYVRMINERGGINGRKVTLISLDDGYSPPKTVEQTRRLVEQDNVLGIFNSLGTAPNAAIQEYLNEQHVPHFAISGASKLTIRRAIHGRWGSSQAMRTKGASMPSTSCITSRKRRSPFSTERRSRQGLFQRIAGGSR